jgi:signal transduction histidine kinase
VATTLWVLLLILHGAFFIVAFSAFAQVLGFLPSPRSAVRGAVVLTAMLVVMLAIKMQPVTPAPFLFAVFSAAAAVFLSLWVGAIIRQSQERHRLIEELEMTRAELAAAERLAGKLEERQRLAREIHDTLAQGFISIVTLLEATDAKLADGQGTARPLVGQALDTARDNLAEARRFVWALQPEALDRSSLAEALGRVAERLQQETGVATGLVVTGTPQVLSAQAGIALLRAAQEGSANIRNHAHATGAVLTLTYFDDEVVLDVRDDGRGFDPDALDGYEAGLGGGFGLRGLKARLTALGGALDVESTPGEGTVLVARLPLVAGREPNGVELT